MPLTEQYGPYRVTDPAQCAAVIDQYPETARALLDIPALVAAHFPDSPLYLSVFADYDAGGQALVVMVDPLCAPEEAVDRWCTFLETWVEHPAHETEGLHLTVGYC